MPYLVIAYPELEKADFKRIQRFRRDHDPQYNLIEPHFTLVFHLPESWAADLSQEVNKVARTTTPIKFILRCATLNRDAFRPVYHSFLVSDEGNSQIIKLHDRLYAGRLRPHLSVDIDYIPHITIGSSEQADRCLGWVAAWHQSEFEIQGRISHLDLIHLSNNLIKTVEKIPLSG